MDNVSNPHHKQVSDGSCDRKRSALPLERNAVAAAGIAIALAWVDLAVTASAASPYYLGSYPVGHQVYELVDDARNDRKLRLDVWYPAADADEPLAVYPHGPSRVAHEAEPVASGDAYPLLVYSHGYGNTSTHNTVYPESLASHGFIVASPNHTGNTDGDLSSGDKSAVERPADVSFVIDQMLAKSADQGDAFSSTIDAGQIGVTGYSFGGYTAFASVTGVTQGGTQVPADPRIKAALPIAPADVFIPSDRAKVTVPTLVLVGKDDDYNLDDTARSDFPRIASDDKCLGLLAGADHVDVGWSLCQQSPAGKSCFNDSELATISQYGVAFFSRYLEADTSFDSMLTVAYASEHFPKVEFWQQAIVDTNNDGRATLVEFGRLKDNFGITGRNAVFSRGDFNRDHRIDLTDFGLLKLNFSGPPAAAVPEPDGRVLLGLGLVAAWGWSRWGRGSFGAQR